MLYHVLGQSEAWKAHHRKFCKTFPRYEASPAFASLADDQKTDAVLLTHLVAEISSKSLSYDDSASEIETTILSDSFPFTNFMSLLGRDVPPTPPVACRPDPASPSPSDLFSRFGRNNFIVHSHLLPIAHGVFPMASRLFNHSCTPNAAAKYVLRPAKTPQMVIVALRNISHDEEVRIYALTIIIAGFQKLVLCDLLINA